MRKIFENYDVDSIKDITKVSRRVLNKFAKKIAGTTYPKMGGEDKRDLALTVMNEALGDSNFHSEVKELKRLLPYNEEKFSEIVYDDWDTYSKISNASGWDGGAIFTAFVPILRKCCKDLNAKDIYNKVFGAMLERKNSRRFNESNKRLSEMKSIFGDKMGLALFELGIFLIDWEKADPSVGIYNPYYLLGVEGQPRIGYIIEDAYHPIFTELVCYEALDTLEDNKVELFKNGDTKPAKWPDDYLKLDPFFYLPSFDDLGRPEKHYQDFLAKAYRY